MVCIYCSKPTSVSNSRRNARTNRVWRRRQCKNCQALFTSVEQADLPTSFSIKGQKSTLEPFRREILFVSIYEACKHLKRPETAAMALTDTIVSRLLKRGSPTIERNELVTLVTQVLSRFNQAAAISYAVYHPSK